MKNILDEIKSKASALNKTIVLPEGEDKRVVVAAVETVKQGIAKIVLLGDENGVKELNDGKELEGVTVIKPVNYA